MWYADCQRLFNLDKKWLVERLLSPSGYERFIPSFEDVGNVYRSLFETTSPPDDSECMIWHINDDCSEDQWNSVITSFTAAEVVAACKRMEQSSSGPDRLSVMDLWRVKIELLMFVHRTVVVWRPTMAMDAESDCFNPHVRKWFVICYQLACFNYFISLCLTFSFNPGLTVKCSVWITPFSVCI